MPFPYEEFDLSGVRTYPLDSRRSKARAEDFARPVAEGVSFSDLVRVAAGHPRGTRPQARCERASPPHAPGSRGIVWGIGAHVIKTGVSPVLDRSDATAVTCRPWR